MSANALSGKLSALKVKQSKPKDKLYKLSDGRGLNLEVRPNGSKYWRLSYRYQNKQKTLAIGVYPIVTLADARESMIEAKRLLLKNIDPSSHKRQQKIANTQNTFKQLAGSWYQKESGHWGESHSSRVWQTLEADAFPALGSLSVTNIKAADVLQVIKKIESRGALDIAGRVKQRISAIFRYAIQTGIIDSNPVDALQNVIQTRKVEHRKALNQDEVPAFLHALDVYDGRLMTRYALQFLMHTFVRPGEVRSAEWVDIDIKKAEWRIPALKMKMNEEHIVPLSKQAVKILALIRKESGRSKLVFPGYLDPKKPMSENTLNDAIKKRLKFTATSHGFRALASTILNEEGFRVDVIERQLAHGERNKVRAAYNRSQYIKERETMMQWYSDHLDSLKNALP